MNDYTCQRSWISDKKRRKKCGVPWFVRFKKKTELAWEMIRQAKKKIPFNWIGMDSLYGRDSWLRDKIDKHDMIYIADIPCNLRVWLHKPKIGVPKMKKAGVKHIAFGIESGNQDVLDYFNKGITLEQIRKAVNLSKKMGFISSGNFILGAPFETREHIENSIKFACSLPLDFAGFSPLHYRFGSDIWNEAVEKGLLKPDENEVIADSNRGLANFTKEELQEFCRIGLKKFYYRPSYMFQQITKAVYRKNFKILKVGLKRSEKN